MEGCLDPPVAVCPPGEIKIDDGEGGFDCIDQALTCAPDDECCLNDIPYEECCDGEQCESDLLALWITIAVILVLLLIKVTHWCITTRGPTVKDVPRLDAVYELIEISYTKEITGPPDRPTTGTATVIDIVAALPPYPAIFSNCSGYSISMSEGYEAEKIGIEVETQTPAFWMWSGSPEPPTETKKTSCFQITVITILVLILIANASIISCTCLGLGVTCQG